MAEERPTKQQYMDLAKNLVKNNEETGKSAAATIMLVNALNSTLNAQSTLAKSFTSVGRDMSLFSSDIDLVGMNLTQSAKLFAEINAEGIRQGREQVIANVAVGSLLGKNTKSMLSLVAFNEQSLGATAAQNAALISSTIELGARFQVDSDKLVSAMQKLGATLISAAATYGAQSSLAIQQATGQLVAELGTGAEGLITSVMNKMAAGTAEAGKLAAILGVDTAAFRGTDPTQIVNTVKEMLAQVGNQVGGFRGRAGSEFVMQPLMQAIGIDANFVALSDRISEGFLAQNELTLEQIRGQILMRDINTSIAEAQKGFQMILMPFIKGIAGAANFFISGPGQVLLPLIHGISVALGTLITLSLSILAWEKIKWAYNIAKDLPFIGKFAAVAVGIGTIAVGAMGAVDSLGSIKSTSTDQLDESKKQTELMKNDLGGNANLLNNINSSLSLLNAINEQQLVELEEANTKDVGAVNLNMGGNVHQTIDPSQSILGGNM